jgi:hypothetical protein
MNFIQKMIFGQALRIGSKWAVDSVKWFYKKYAGKIEAVEGAIENAPEWLEEKTGIDLFTDEKQSQWDKTIELTFDEIEHTLTDGAKWRLLIRAAKAGTFDDLVKAKIEELEGTAWAKAVMSLPGEAKDYISKLKERLGRVKFREIWNVFNPDIEIEEKHVKAAFKKLASIKKDNKTTFEKLIEESKKRQESLNG